MPLRDHFRPPTARRGSWEGFHGGWPMVMVQHLARVLPDGFQAEPRVHLGTAFEIDVCTFEGEPGRDWEAEPVPEPSGTATATAPTPTLAVETEFPDEYAYEVLVFDAGRDRRLVAAVEIVSPANKDRPDSRQLFVAKCATLLRKGVCVSLIDLVTVRQFNLYAELLALLGRRDPAIDPDPPPTYAATCRRRAADGKTRLETWSYPLAVGQPLPTLPVWLDDRRHVSLDLEASYEDTCRALRLA